MDETPPSLAEVRETLRKFKGGKGAGLCNISTEMLKTWVKAMLQRLPAVLSALWSSGVILPDCKKEVSSLSRN